MNRSTNIFKCGIYQFHILLCYVFFGAFGPLQAVILKVSSDWFLESKNCFDRSF